MMEVITGSQPKPAAARRTKINQQTNRSGNALHRNKACLSCRARKTKCDAVKPICSSCKRLGPEQQSQCKYDRPPKWLESVVCPDRTQQNRIIELEAKLESLEQKLTQLRTFTAIKQEQHRLLVGAAHEQTSSATKSFFTSQQNILLSAQEDFHQPVYADHHHSLIGHPTPIDDHHHPLVIRQHDGQLTQAEFNPYPYNHFVSPILDSPSPSATSSVPDPSPHHQITTTHIIIIITIICPARTFTYPNLTGTLTSPRGRSANCLSRHSSIGPSHLSPSSNRSDFSHASI
ncbi:hypothetical protein KEM48_010736 [Puccinia striiformis f. sp. tritici PST-130]|nr:hypothetical protein KEM48_010736 [Puccinia striiformis f. sp. tritici PST-130]